jgi:hypothetical protein
MAVDALELRPRSTLQLFDAAVRLCSRTLGVWAITLPAGAALTAATFELIETLSRHHPPARAAALFTAAWMFRAISQGAAAHYLEQQLLETQEPSSWRAFVAALRHAPALVFCAGYCLTLNAMIWCFSLGIGYFLVTAHLAAYAVAMKGKGSLLGLYGTCSKMLGPARHTASTLRLCGLTQVIVGLNLHLLVNGLLMVASKLLAFNVTFLDRFTSLDNPVWVGAVIALTFSLFEPVRAASAALMLIDGRVRQEGLDLLTQLEQLPRRKKPRTAAGAAVLALLLAPAAARAQDDWSGTWTPGQPKVGQQSTAMSQRLRDVVVDCGLSQRFTSQQLHAVDALPQSSRAALSRFVARIERLAMDEESCDAASDELERGLEQISAAASDDGTAAASRDEAKAVLARPEFAVEPPVEARSGPDEEPGSFSTWWKDLLKRFFEWLFEPERDRRVTPPPSFDLGLINGLSNLVMFGAVLLVVGVLLWLLIRSAGRRSSEEVAAEQSGVNEAPLPSDPMNALSRPPEGWAGLADELAQQGRFRDAIRNLYLALLSRLHRDGAIDYDPAKSNWDYFRGFKGPMRSLTPFRELTRRFDFAWYGNLEVSPASWATFRSLTQPLLAPHAEAEAASA